MVIKNRQAARSTKLVSRNQAVRRLQLRLADFRKLCIYKGIFPRSNTSLPKFHMKDLAYLACDPLVATLRRQRALKKKLKKVKAMKDPVAIDVASRNIPTIKLDHVIKQRYPTFEHAIKDLNDALSTVFTASYLPCNKYFEVSMIQKCRKLSLHFLHYVIISRSLRKVFISVKGFYLQAEICGCDVTWLIPHNMVMNIPSKIDFRVISSFLDLHTTLLGFICFKLYHSIDVVYPPKVIYGKDSVSEEEIDTAATLNLELQKKEGSCLIYPTPDEFPETSNNDADKLTTVKDLEEFTNIFSKLVFYLSREVPIEVLTFIIRCFGGTVLLETYDGKNLLTESDPRITHHIVDRPFVKYQFANRVYVQPQWIFDCVNNKSLLPSLEYLPGCSLPPHLSPFERNINDAYREVLAAEKEMNASESERKAELAKRRLENERRNMAIKTMPKKTRRLYELITKSRKRQTMELRKVIAKKKRLAESKL